MNKAFLILIFSIFLEKPILGYNTLSKNVTNNLKINKERNIRNLQNEETDEPSRNISVDVPISENGYNKGIKNATIAFNKFYNYHLEPESSTTILYNVLLLFFNRTIPRIIAFRLRISYSFGRLRNLQNDEGDIAESVPSSCVINNIELAGQIGTGSNIIYNCEAEAQFDTSNIISITLNTDVPMRVDNYAISFDYIGFNGNADEEAVNIISTQGVNLNGEPVEIRNTRVSSQSQTSVIFRGNVSLNEGRSTMEEIYDNREEIIMLLFDISEGIEIYREYACFISGFGETNGSCEMTCDTSEQALQNNAQNFDNSVSKGDRMISLHMDPTDLTEVDTANFDDDESNPDVINDTTTNSDSDSSSSALLIGLIIGGVVLIAIVVSSIFIYKKCKRHPNNVQTTSISSNGEITINNGQSTINGLNTKNIYEIELKGDIIEVNFKKTTGNVTKVKIGKDNTIKEVIKLYYNKINKKYNKDIHFVCNATPLNDSNEKIKNVIKDIKNDSNIVVMDIDGKLN